MKFIGLPLFLLLFGLDSFCQIEAVQIQVSGLTCPMCSRTVQKSLEKVPFVAKVNADLNAQEYEITFTDKSAINLDALKKAVQDAGFSVACFQIVGSFENIEVRKDLPLVLNNQLFIVINMDGGILNGARKLTIVEKGFLSAKLLKKYCNDAKQKCFDKTTTEGSQRIYQVVI